MNGAELLIYTAINAGIEVCFANPGTTEMLFLEASDYYNSLRMVLGLQENVCTGAADGYSRVKNRPAMTLLHLGVGLANGYANLHNARKASSPIFNVVGQHMSWHAKYDAAPLTSDIMSVAKSVSSWVHNIDSSENIAQHTITAIKTALSGKIATLIFPHDYQLAVVTKEDIKLDFSYDKPDKREIENLAKKLLDKKKTLFIFGGRALYKRGISAVNKIKSAINCDLLVETFPNYLERGIGCPQIDRIPYLPKQSHELFAKYQRIVLVGAKEPVIFFGDPKYPSKLISIEQELIDLSDNSQDIVVMLELLADCLNLSHTPINEVQESNLTIPTEEKLTPNNIASLIAALQPEGAIIVDESVTLSPIYYQKSFSSKPHSYLTITGAAIGYGMPCSIGAAIAAPDKVVINLQADGSAAYTVQSLWTQAREGLNIKTIILANNSYEILRQELERAGKINLGRNTSKLTQLSEPRINWKQISQGFGVPSISVSSISELSESFAKALETEGPYLIEVLI